MIDVVLNSAIIRVARVSANLMLSVVIVINAHLITGASNHVMVADNVIVR